MIRISISDYNDETHVVLKYDWYSHHDNLVLTMIGFKECDETSPLPMCRGECTCCLVASYRVALVQYASHFIMLHMVLLHT